MPAYSPRGATAAAGVSSPRPTKCLKLFHAICSAKRTGERLHRGSARHVDPTKMSENCGAPREDPRHATSYTRAVVADRFSKEIFPCASLEKRALGAYLGFAVGDALGATVEFMTATEIRATYGVHRQVVGGGWLRLKPGQITDDTQMCLALGRALLATNGWDLSAVADAFVAWMRSRPVDIGHTCRRGLRRYQLEATL